MSQDEHTRNLHQAKIHMITSSSALHEANMRNLNAAMSKRDDKYYTGSKNWLDYIEPIIYGANI